MGKSPKSSLSRMIYFNPDIVFDNSIMLFVNSFNFPSILTNKYMEIAIGNPKLAIVEYISCIVSPPFNSQFTMHDSQLLGSSFRDLTG